MTIKKILICCLSLISLSQLHGQTDSLPKPIENIFEVVWTDTISLKGKVAAPLLNGNLVIPPYGNDGCFLAETGQKLYYTFSPHQKIIRKNLENRYVLFKTEGSNTIFDIESGKSVFYKLYNETKDRSRIPRIPQNRVINSRYICFASGLKTFTCIDTNTMKEKWNFESDYELYDSYIEHEQVIYVGSEKYLYAININSGSELWKIEVGKTITNLLLDNNKIYLCVENKGIVAINIAEKSIIYKQDYVENARKLAVSKDYVYYVDNNIFAFDIQTGKMRFYSEDYESCTNTESFFLYKDYIFAQSCARNNYFIEGFDRHTGEKIYKANKEIEGNPAEDFLINATYFSVPYGNMIYATSMSFIENKFWVAKIYGVIIKDDL